MLNKQQYQKLQGLGLSPSQMNQVVNKAGGVEQRKSALGFGMNVLKSGAGVIGGLADTVLHPVQTAKNVFNLGTGLVGKVLPGQQPNEEYADALINFYKERYGGIDNIKRTIYDDPVGFALDVSTVLGGGSAAVKGLSALSGSSKLGRAGQILRTASEITDPLSFSTKITGKVTSPLFSRASRGLESASENILTKGLGSPKQLQKIEKITGMKPGKLISKYKAYDVTPEAFTRGLSTAQKEYESIISSGKRVNIKDILDALDTKIQELAHQERLGSITAGKQLESLMQRRQNLASVSGRRTYLTPKQVIEVKRAVYKDVRPSTFNMAYQGTPEQLSAVDTYRSLISGIETSAPGTKQLGREEAGLMQLRDMAESSQARGKVRQNINFTKLGGAGVGGVVGGLPGAAVGFASEQFLNSPQGIRAQSAALRGGGKVLQNARVPQMQTPTLVKGVRLSPRMNNTTTQTREQQKSGSGVIPKTQRQKISISKVSSKSIITPPTTLQRGAGISFNPYKRVKLRSGGY